MWGNIIGALGSIAGGLINADAQADANAANLMFQRNQFKRNARLQKLFANRAIGWKVRDARRAGIHPIYALGAPTTSYAPQTVGNVHSPVTGIGDAISASSQHIGRAIEAGSTHDGRFTQQLQGLTLQRAELENALLSSQLARVNSPGTPPAIPAEGQRWLVDGQVPYPSVGGLFKDEPVKRNISDPAAPWSEAAPVSDLNYTRTKDGYAVVPSKDFNDRAEDNLVAQLTWFVRNQLVPSIYPSKQTPPSHMTAGPGERVRLNPFTGEYYKQKRVWKGPSWMPRAVSEIYW